MLANASKDVERENIFYLPIVKTASQCDHYETQCEGFSKSKNQTSNVTQLSVLGHIPIELIPTTELLAHPCLLPGNGSSL